MSQPYQLTSSILAANAQSVIREADGAFIPDDPMNADYQAYLAWLAEGNTPDPAPPPTPSNTVITTAAFFARFTQSELEASWAAGVSAPAIGTGLMNLIVAGSVDLTSTDLKTLMDMLVSASAITSDRETAILTA